MALHCICFCFLDLEGHLVGWQFKGKVFSAGMLARIFISRVVVGDDVRALLGLDDAVIELDLTPNRGDCLSVMGVAREVGVLTSTRINAPAMPSTPAVDLGLRARSLGTSYPHMKVR